MHSNKHPPLTPTPLHAPAPHAHGAHAHPAPAPAPLLDEANSGIFTALLPQLQKAVAEEGYTIPTPIQQQTIKYLLEGRDVLGCAQTGTGKTAAFTLPLLDYLTQHQRPRVRNKPRALILAPTRELAAQIGDSIRTYGRHLHITHTVIFGGVGQQPQVQALARGVDIVVATPGRLLDLKQQGHIRLDAVEVFVLDEADRMLDMGFINDIRKVIAALPAKRQSLFFSATLTPDAVALSRTMVHNPVHVTVTPEQPAVERIVQKVLFVDRNQKDTLLTSLLADEKLNRVVVFTQQKHVADKVTKKLNDARIHAVAIHGNKSQGARTRAMDGFKTGRIRVLVATDIAARGIDVDGITHVINYQLPVEPETYVHRIGRTARAGAGGDAVSLCCAEERDFLRAIERLIGTAVPVDRDHRYHSESARLATGAAAKPLPRGQGHGGGGGGRGGQSARRTPRSGSFGRTRR
jgi:ATP-dependent RNA helicase RhlE